MPSSNEFFSLIKGKIRWKNVDASFVQLDRSQNDLYPKDIDSDDQNWGIMFLIRTTFIIKVVLWSSVSHDTGKDFQSRLDFDA